MILNSSDGELVDLYNYFKHQDFTGYSVLRPTFDSIRFTVFIHEEKRPSISPTRMTIMKEMYRRAGESFLKSCYFECFLRETVDFSIRSVEKPTIYKSNISSKHADIVLNDITYTHIGSGLKRDVYVSPDGEYVVKVPKNNLGEEENIREYETYTKNPGSIYAKCELLDDNYLKMEYVEPVYFKKGDDYPEWTLSIAEHQVGYTRDKRLVAYDYGSDI